MVVSALKGNELSSESDLYIFSDNAKYVSQRESVDKVRGYLKGIKGFKSVNIVERPANFGLSKSITTGIDYVLERHTNIIVLEDDIITSPKFLSYMNQALSKYRNDASVASISGYSYPTDRPLPEHFFLNRIECWGWGTWSDQWTLFNPDGNSLADKIRSAGLVREFNYDNNFPFFKMLCDQALGKNDSWAIRWDASVFLAGRYTLYPGKSYVKNFGMDGEGTNCGVSSSFDTLLNTEIEAMDRVDVSHSSEAWGQYVSFYKGLKKSFWRRVIDRVRLVIRN